MPLTRARSQSSASSMEHLIEATQIKGDSEAHPFLSPDDEFADFDTWDRSNLDGTELKKPRTCYRWEYAREALKTGLMLERQPGRQSVQVRHGRRVATRTPRSTAVEEDNFFGKHSGVEPGPAPLGARGDRGSGSGPDRSRLAAGGRRPYARASGRPRTHARRSSTP